MERRVLGSANERITPDDFNNIGLFTQTAIDHVVHDLGLADAAFQGFNVSGAPGAAKVTVGAGRLYLGDDDRTRVYFNDDEGGVEVNLLALLPVATSRIITIGVNGTEGPTNGEPRTILTDAQSRATIGKVVAVEMRRRAEVVPYGGKEQPDPQPLALPANVLAVAYVLLAPTGIISITPAADNRVPSVRANDLAIRENLVWRAKSGSKLETLGSDISALAAGLRGLASDVFVREIAGDVSLLKEKAQLPSAYSSYDADSFLRPTKSNFNHVDMLCTVEEGIRFPPANASDSQLGLLNSLDTKVSVQQFFALPAYREAARISQLENDGEIAISQYQHQTQTLVQRTRTVTKIRYGTPFSVCTNSADWWADTVIDYTNWTVYKGGATYNIVGQAATWIPGHEIWRLEQVWTDQVSEPYWDFNTTTEQASGSILSQTFLNTQDGWLTSIDLLLTKVAAAGDIMLLVTETTSAAPDISKVIGRTTAYVAAPQGFSSLHVGVNRTPIAPVLLKKGGRYSLTLITSGNHFVGFTENNKFAQGSLFYSSDGAFQVGDLTKDMCFGLNFAEFLSPYVEVQLNPLQLGGGIAAIDLQMPSAVPDGTQLVFSVQDPANGVWKPLTKDSAGNALLGLPPLVQFKVTLIGTTDLMPGFGVGSDARVKTSRPRPDGRHISTKRTLPAPCKNFNVRIRLEAWRGSPHHTHALKLLTGPLLDSGVGDTITSPLVVTEEAAPDDPQNAIIRVYSFTLGAAVSAFALRQEIQTDNVLSTFHVARRIDIEQP